MAEEHSSLSLDGLILRGNAAEVLGAASPEDLALIASCRNFGQLAGELDKKSPGITMDDVRSNPVWIAAMEYYRARNAAVLDAKAAARRGKVAA